MSIMRAQLPRELYAGGGITQVRQPYFLGKVVRAVTKPIKKTLDAPLIEVKELESIPPVHDSAIAILSFFLFKRVIILLFKLI